MSKTAINRQQEGLVIANINGAIKRISESKYVMSQVRDGFAFVMLQFQKHKFWPPSLDPSQLP
jgi:multidrug efflux pump subunit AcrB